MDVKLLLIIMVLLILVIEWMLLLLMVGVFVLGMLLIIVFVLGVGLDGWDVWVGRELFINLIVVRVVDVILVTVVCSFMVFLF